jgi:DNA-binding response OmpR family regulator
MDLRGRSVLLLEDDFYEARDTQHALQHAGAHVIRPFDDSESALRSIVSVDPSCAILDVYLRGSPRFNVAEALLDRGIPIIFVSGADSKIPEEFSQAYVVEKPVDFQSLLRLTALLSGKRVAYLKKEPLEHHFSRQPQLTE